MKAFQVASAKASSLVSQYIKLPAVWAALQAHQPLLLHRQLDEYLITVEVHKDWDTMRSPHQAQEWQVYWHDNEKQY